MRVLLLLALLALLARADEPVQTEEPPAEEVVPFAPIIDAVSAATPRYLPVTFTSHDQHAVPCATCHHDTAEGATPVACSTCHEAGVQPDLQNASHQLCRGCHASGGSGPTECLDCHTERP